MFWLWQGAKRADEVFKNSISFYQVSSLIFAQEVSLRIVLWVLSIQMPVHPSGPKQPERKGNFLIVPSERAGPQNVAGNAS